jgi:Ca2+-transporting ATPase
MPLLPAQLLWLNLVTNGVQDVFLAAEGAEGDELSFPPRDPKEPIFNGLMVRRVLFATTVMGGIGVALFWWLIESGRSVDEARNLLLMLFVLFENFLTFSSRSERHSVFRQKLSANPPLVAGVLGAQLVHVTAMQIPFLRDVLGVAPISPADWILLLALAATVLVAMEFDKHQGGNRHRWNTHSN